MFDSKVEFYFIFTILFFQYIQLNPAFIQALISFSPLEENKSKTFFNDAQTKRVLAASPRNISLLDFLPLFFSLNQKTFLLLFRFEVTVCTPQLKSKFSIRKQSRQQRIYFLLVHIGNN